MVWDRQCLEDSEQKYDWINDWNNDWINKEGVYRAAPATPEIEKKKKSFCAKLK